MSLLDRLPELSPSDGDGDTLARGDAVDHDLSWPLCFPTPTPTASR